MCPRPVSCDRDTSALVSHPTDARGGWEICHWRQTAAILTCTWDYGTAPSPDSFLQTHTLPLLSPKITHVIHYILSFFFSLSFMSVPLWCVSGYRKHSGKVSIVTFFPQYLLCMMLNLNKQSVCVWRFAVRKYGVDWSCVQPALPDGNIILLSPQINILIQ